MWRTRRSAHSTSQARTRRRWSSRGASCRHPSSSPHRRDERRSRGNRRSRMRAAPPMGTSRRLLLLAISGSGTAALAKHATREQTWQSHEGVLAGSPVPRVKLSCALRASARPRMTPKCTIGGVPLPCPGTCQGTVTIEGSVRLVSRRAPLGYEPNRALRCPGILCSAGPLGTLGTPLRTATSTVGHRCRA